MAWAEMGGKLEEQNSFHDSSAGNSSSLLVNAMKIDRATPLAASRASGSRSLSNSAAILSSRRRSNSSISSNVCKPKELNQSIKCCTKRQHFRKRFSFYMENVDSTHWPCWKRSLRWKRRFWPWLWGWRGWHRRRAGPARGERGGGWSLPQEPSLLPRTQTSCPETPSTRVATAAEINTRLDSAITNGYTPKKDRRRCSLNYQLIESIRRRGGE